jgi:hypothetical protein
MRLLKTASEMRLLTMRRRSMRSETPVSSARSATGEPKSTFSGVCAHTPPARATRTKARVPAIRESVRYVPGAFSRSSRFPLRFPILHIELQGRQDATYAGLKPVPGFLLRIQNSGNDATAIRCAFYESVCSPGGKGRAPMLTKANLAPALGA